MNEKNLNNRINNKEISSAITLDNQNSSKEIKMENEQPYDVRNTDNKKYPITVNTKEGSVQIFKQIQQKAWIEKKVNNAGA